ncbi:MAG: spore coat protein CotH [Clostridium sp.]
MRWLINKKSITVIAVVMALVVILIGSITMTGNTSDLAATTQTSYVENILDKDKITEIDIDIDEADWDWLMANASDKEPRSCTITINGETFYNVGINPKGNSSLSSIVSDETTDRFSFKLDFGAYVEDQTCFGLEKIALNNVISDSSYMKEALSYDLFEFMDVATPAYAYTNIKLNGEDWGVYLAVEIIDETFVERQFGTTNGNLYKPESVDMVGGNAGGNDKGGMPNKPNNQGNGEVPAAEDKVEISNEANEESKTADEATDKTTDKEAQVSVNKGADLKYTRDLASDYSAIQEGSVFKTTSDKDFEKVIEMIKNLNSGSNLEKYLDVDEVLRFFAVNTFLVNLDGYAGEMYHNYYLYEKDGVFQIIPWDLNESFAGFRMTDGIKAINFPIDIPVTGNLEDAPLIGKLLEVTEYKELYHSYLKEISEEYINSGVYEESIVKIDKLINSYVEKDATALYTYEEYSAATPMMVTFGLDRAKSIEAQLNGTEPSTTYGTLATTVDLSSLGAKDKAGGGNKAGGDNKAAVNDEAVDIDNVNMQSIMEVVKESNGAEFTAEQEETLKTLGADDDMLNDLENMGSRGGLQAEGNTGNQSIMQIGIIAASVVLLFIGTLFVFKFKRKRFRAR